MNYFELTFRFDDKDASLSRFKGLSIQDLVGFLNALNKAVSSKNNLVLSEIKGNCYAPVISTPVKTEFEEIKVLNAEVEKGNYHNLNKNGKAYFNYLSGLLNKGLSLSVYDNDKNFYKSIETLPIKKDYPYFYNTNQVTGVLTQIGSRNLESKNTIFIDSYPIEIKINKEQESRLKQHFKSGKIDFFITERINKESKKVEQAELNNFSISKASLSFYESIEIAREKHGNYFSEQINA